MPLGLYISVPFCRTKCSYCNFASDVFSKSAYENYVSRLIEDIASSHEVAAKMGCMFEPTADSIYLGGGTPSILDGAQLLRIFTAVRDHFAVASDAEITVECAPGTLTPALIETLLQCGANRVSLGVQSFVDREAQAVGRLHKRATVLEEIGRLREAGLDNTNIDLIAGLPHQTAESWAFSVSETIATGVPHASVYMLEVDDDSRLGRELMAGGARYHAHFVPDDDAIADFYQQACDMLAVGGISQYEISNFARVTPKLRDGSLQSNQSQHNLKYWTRQPYLGFGVDAHSMLPANCENGEHCDAVRFSTPDSLEAFMNRAPRTVTPVSAQAAIEESFFLGLRLNRGIDLKQLRKQFSAALTGTLEFMPNSDEQQVLRFAHDDNSLLDTGLLSASRSSSSSLQARPSNAILRDAVLTWETAIEQCVQQGLLEQHGSNLCLTARGRLLSNEVFARFLVEETKVGTAHVNPR
jgi:oxygen-independent coproporphyrinogen-3 oxidase